MNALVLSEASGTISDEHQQALNHYRGNFLPVKKLSDRLDSHADTDTYIISDDRGLLHGTDNVQDAPTKERDQTLNDAIDLLFDEISNSDIVVILTTSETFRTVVVDNWKDLVDATNTDSIWCLGSSQATLNECDIESLRDTIHKLHTYQRVGMAPIDNETQDALIETVEQISQQRA
jgi:hypothetical protein